MSDILIAVGVVLGIANTILFIMLIVQALRKKTVKKIAILFTSTLVIGIGVFASAGIFGEPTYNGFEYYKLDNGEIKIMEYLGEETTVVIPSEIRGNPVTTISREIFMDCNFITSVVIPDGVREIGEYAFYDCVALTSVTIPDGVTEIGKNAFYGCISLESVALSSSLTSINERTFYDCKALTDVTIPDGVTEIGEEAFARCSSLENIVLPESVISIADNAFVYCPFSIETQERILQINPNCEVPIVLQRRAEAEKAEREAAQKEERRKAARSNALLCAEEVILKYLKDPEPIIKKSKIIDNDEYYRFIVRMTVNSRNSFGGYTGDTDYYVRFRIDSKDNTSFYYNTLSAVIECNQLSGYKEFRDADWGEEPDDWIY